MYSRLIYTYSSFGDYVAMHYLCVITMENYNLHTSLRVSSVL